MAEEEIEDHMKNKEKWYGDAVKYWDVSFCFVVRKKCFSKVSLGYSKVKRSHIKMTLRTQMSLGSKMSLRTQPNMKLNSAARLKSKSGSPTLVFRDRRQITVLVLSEFK